MSTGGLGKWKYYVHRLKVQGKYKYFQNKCKSERLIVNNHVRIPLHKGPENSDCTTYLSL